MSSGLILKMHSGLQWGDRRAREVHLVKGGMFLWLLTEG
jgi:hypothetical protein